ncbi:efflux RND transporter periplasmic adaptor subunit [Spirosoma sp. HMF4905]|uniref:Efflux RND transporter periplasmic adaptor subunit n=1 Tax=Spirosoma arboris TaxID=2682092 RepID=A0A7K1SDS1_9BACT|nr:efflux RND transporter periplasmic adaptor subunit [Spirosoma arboris]MVM31940.1 efflux RND transporter periplasmic adaptor subunit [Spirosoma arboris]
MTFNHSSIRLVRLCLLLIGGIVGVLACQSTEKSNTDTTTEKTTESTTAVDSTEKSDDPVRVALTQAQYTVAGIQLGQPVPRSLSTTLKVNGSLDVPAQNQVSVSVPFGGYIRKIGLEPGMRISKGQTLVVLENPEYIQLQQDYLDTKAKLEYADLEFERQQELSRENVNALKVFQQTRANRQSLQAHLAGMAQRLALLHINPATLTPATLTRIISVPSPVSGFVTDVPVNNGRYLNPADVLVQITDLTHPHVRLTIFEKDISRIHVGQLVRFGMGGDASLIHRGEIFLIGKSIAADRTISVLVHPDGYANDFIPGGYISAQIDVKTQPLPALPEEAIVNFGGKHYIYILEKKEVNPITYQFRQVEVKPGVRENGYVSITLPGDINAKQTPIVVKGAYNLLAKLNNSEEE